MPLLVFLARVAGALALTTCAALPCSAQTAATGRPISAPAGYVPAEAIYCDDGSGHAISCALGGSSATLSRISYVATASGAGYAIGDQLERVVATTPSTGAVVLAYWVNVTQATILPAAPVAASISQPQSSGSATAARQDALLAAMGTPAQAGGKVDTVVQGPWVDTGGVFGTAAATLIAASTVRRGFSVQVQGASDTTGSTGCWINGVTAATADYHSLFIPRGSYYETASSHVGTATISIICSAASTSVYARSW